MKKLLKKTYKIKIYWADEQSLFAVDGSLRSLVKKAIFGTLATEGFERDVSVSVTFTDNAQIRETNREYREIDSATDVLSFPMYDMKHGDVPPDDMPVELGDIVLSLERADEQAKEFGHPFEREVAFLVAHSTLHLLGYDHVNSEEEELDMRERQRKIMKFIGTEVK